MRKLVQLIPVVACCVLASIASAQDAGHRTAANVHAAVAKPAQSPVGRTMADLIRALHDASAMQAQATQPAPARVQANAVVANSPAAANAVAVDSEQIAVQTSNTP